MPPEGNALRIGRVTVAGHYDHDRLALNVTVGRAGPLGAVPPAGMGPPAGLPGSEVLFLDEPTIGLDLLAKQRFRELLWRLNTERRTTIFSALAVQATIMGVNDVVWIVFLLLFFRRRVGTVRGWDGDTILVLLAVIITGAGISLGVFANSRRVGGDMAVGGQLDSVLALPVEPLSHLLLRRMEAIHIGDVLFGTLLLVLAGSPTPARVVAFVFAVACAATLVTSFLVLTGSLAFYFGRNEGGELGFHAMILLASYPADMFAGVAKVLLYTVVPAAFVSTVPAHLIEDFDVGHAAGLAAVSVAFALAARTVFTRGLRRYVPGSVWTNW